MEMNSATDYNSSYLFGKDEISGWGHRYFFTFYNEIGDRDLAKTAEVTGFSFIFVISIIANGTIATVVLKYPDMRTVTNCFLLNLTVADLLFASGIPTLLHARLSPEWQLGDTLCKLLPYSQFVCVFVLLWTLTWISMDRHRCIVIPPFRSQLTQRRAASLTIITWLIALIVFLPVTFLFRVEKVQNNLHICTIVFPRNTVINISLFFTIPVIILTCVAPLTLFVYHYQRIFHKLKKTRARWKNKIQENITKISDDNNKTFINIFAQREERRLNRHLRIIRILLINVLVVLIMWLPITVVIFLIYLDGRRPNEDKNFFLRSHHFIWALQIALLNTIINPLLYGILSENFRSSFIKNWSMKQRKKSSQKKHKIEMNQFNRDGFKINFKMPNNLKQQLPFTNSASYYLTVD